MVTGELDIHADHLLYGTLREALDRSQSGVDLDLSKVDFCDCSGLNVLLRVRQRALKQGKTVTVHAASTPVGRLLDTTHTLLLFASPDYVGDTAPAQNTGPDIAPHFAQYQVLPEDAVQDLIAEVIQLRRAMQTRPDIDMARGLLMASFSLSAEDAWSVLVEVSQRTNTKLHQLAKDLLDTISEGPLPVPLQQQLAAAVEAVTHRAA